MDEGARMTDIRERETAQAYLAQAEDFLRHNDIVQMSEALERLTSSPECPATYRLEAARLFAAAGATADAIRFYREAGSAFIDPEGDTVRAREALNEGHALDLQDLEILFTLARVDIIEGHPRAALAKFTHIVRKSHQAHAPALFEAACIHQELGQHDQAVLMLRKVLDHDKSNVQAIVSMGQRLQSMGMLPEAVGYFFQAATAAHAAGQIGTCRHMINVVLGLDSNNQNARRLLAELDDEPASADVRAEEIAPQQVRRRDYQQVRTVTPSTAPAGTALAAEIDDLTARSDRMQRKMSALAGVVAELEETVATLKIELSVLRSGARSAEQAAVKRKAPKAVAVAAKTKARDSAKRGQAPKIKPDTLAQPVAPAPRR
jgi:tetratricopeptide (TPR) repeat protein